MSDFFGLDLGNSSLKVVQLSGMGFGRTVESVGLIQNPVGSVELESEGVMTGLVEAVKKVLTQAGIRDKRAVVSVPESKIYSKVITMPAMVEAELSSAIKWEAEQFVPVPVTEVEVDYQIIKELKDSQGRSQVLVYLVAAPKKLLKLMLDFFMSVGVEPIALESEMLPVARALTSQNKLEGASLIIHLGALSTVLGVVEEGQLVLAHYLNTGGMAMTRAIGQSLSLPLMQAEEYKRSYGVEAGQLEGKVRGALLLIWDSVVGEVRKAMEYQASQRGTKIRRVILSGGGAYLPGIGGYLGEKLAGVEVLVGDPFGEMKVKRGVKIPQERAAYVVATGLAMREE